MTAAAPPPTPATPAPGVLEVDRLAPHEQLGRAFKAAMVAVRRLRGRETHRPGTLSYAQYGLLFGLAGGAALSAREIGLAANLTPATVTQMLEGLEQAGLVRRSRSDSDKRVVLTVLTDRGHEVVDEHRARMEPLWLAALEGFSDQELLTAAEVLDRLAQYFDSFGELSCEG